jgi:hypothetical protein
MAALCTVKEIRHTHGEVERQYDKSRLSGSLQGSKFPVLELPGELYWFGGRTGAN